MENAAKISSNRHAATAFLRESAEGALDFRFVSRFLVSSFRGPAAPGSSSWVPSRAGFDFLVSSRRAGFGFLGPALFDFPVFAFRSFPLAVGLASDGERLAVFRSARLPGP